MSKAGKMSLIEQHAEKGVLVVCVLLLIFVLFNWVLSSPRSLDDLPLGEVDQRLATEAKTVWRRNIGTDPEVKNPKDFSADIKAFQAKPLAAGPNEEYPRIWGGGEKTLAFTEVAEPGRPIRVVPPPIMPRPSLKQVAALVGKPSRPKANFAIELPSREWKANWVARPRKKVIHCVASYPVRELEEAWGKMLQTTTLHPKFIVLKVHAQFRERSPGGQWSQPKDVPMSARPIPAQTGAEDEKPMTVPEDVPVIPELKRDDEKDNIGAIEEKKEKVRRDWAAAILQPDYYWLYWAGNDTWQPWKIHLPETAISKAAVKGDPRGAREMIGPSPTKRRPAAPAKKPTKKPTKKPIKKPAKRPTNPAKRAIPPKRTRTGAASRYPTGAAGRYPPTGGMPPAVRRPGAPDMRDRGYGEEGEFGPPRTGVRPPRGKVQPPGRRTRPGAEVEDPQALPPDPTVVPSLRDQMQDGEVLVWFHQDTLLSENKEYQFRLRLEVVNPLYGYIERANAEIDATTLRIATPFSEWSETASLKRSTEFFLVGRAPLQRTVRVRVFAHYLGRWFRQDYTVNEGEPIGGKKAVKMHKPPAPPDAPAMLGAPAARARAAKEDPVLENVTVDFATGVVSVEFDFEKKYVNPKFASMKHDTVEMLYLDHLGRLGRRIPENDKDNTRYKELKELTERKSIKRVAGRP